MNRQVLDFDVEVNFNPLVVRVKRRDRLVSAWATRQALRIVFDVTDIKVPTNMIAGCPDPWSPGVRLESQVSAWEERRRSERDGAFIAAFLYLYYQLNEARRGRLFASHEQVRATVKEDLLVALWDAFNVSAHERLEMISPRMIDEQSGV